MSHIFISYARKDIDFAGKIVQALADNDLIPGLTGKASPKAKPGSRKFIGVSKKRMHFFS